MKKNLQEMEVKAINKSAILESHDGEEFSPITVAKNVLCEDGTTMQDYFDNHSELNISTKIVNSNSMSKVGQGDNVDFSDNVMNGAYEDVVLKGKSLVNVIQGSSKDKVVLPYSFEEGETVTINDTHSNGRLEVEVKGRTLVNLFDKTYPSNKPGLVGAQVYEERELDGKVCVYTKGNNKNYISLKYPPKGDFTIKCKGSLSDEEHSAFQFIVWFEDGTSTVSERKLTTKVNSLEDIVWYYNPTKTVINISLDTSGLSGCYVDINNFVVVEGNHVENDIPYFEGMASVQTPTIQTCGKNLLDPNSVELIVKSNNSAQTITYDTKTDTYECLCPNSFNQMNILFKNKYDVVNTNQMFISGTYESDGGVHEISRKCHLENGEIGFHITHDWKPVTKANVKIMFTKEEITSSTTYERYQSSSLTLPKEIVLRGLSDGVCDTYNTKTKEYTQCTEELVLDGSEDEDIKMGYGHWHKDNTVGFFMEFNRTNRTPSNLKFLSNRFKFRDDYFNVDEECMKYSINVQGNVLLLIRVLRSRLNEISVLGFKSYLSTNPLVIVRELPTPIVTKIDLPSLKTYNTITHLSSTVGEGSLVPTLASDDVISYPVVIKPNTKYSIVAHKDCNYHTTNLNYTFDLGGVTTTCSVNDTITTVTTPTTLSHQELRVKGQGLALSSVRVIEGEVTQDLPYFEGICDCKSPILSNVGKNLWDIDKLNDAVCTNKTNDSFVLKSWASTVLTNQQIREILKPNTKYTMRAKFRLLKGSSLPSYSQVIRFLLYAPNETSTNVSFFLAESTHTIGEEYEVTNTFTTPSDFTTKNLLGYSKRYANDSTWELGEVEFTDVQLEEMSQATEYEPYKSNTTTFDQKDGKTIVLRSLPNGVCDTLNVRTGEYVQNIGEIVLDGVNYKCIKIKTNGDKTKRFDINFTFEKFVGTNSWIDLTKMNASVICDKAICISNGHSVHPNKNAIASFNGILVLFIEDNTILTIEKANEWLQQNPITIQYELATPIVKQVNVEGYPYAYENGHILLESGSQEQSLTPTIEYSIVANRGGQIRSNQRMVERHQKKLDSLYAMTLVNMIDSQYKQVLMELKSELGSEVRTWDIE